MSRITTLWGKKMYAAIFTGQLKPAQINALCKKAAKDSMDPQVHPEKSIGARLSKDIAMLTEAVQTIQPLCIHSHYQSGLTLLHGLVYTPGGRRRRTKQSDEFSERDIITLSHARSIAFVEIQYNFGSYRTDAFPIFEVRSGDGSNGGSFRYYYRSWQSGGGFEIISRA
jgi:hypothetical protein